MCIRDSVVGGWVAKYAFQYLTGGDFGADKQAYFCLLYTSVSCVCLGKSVVNVCSQCLKRDCSLAVELCTGHILSLIHI